MVTIDNTGTPSFSAGTKEGIESTSLIASLSQCECNDFVIVTSDTLPVLRTTNRTTTLPWTPALAAHHS